MNQIITEHDLRQAVLGLHRIKRAGLLADFRADLTQRLREAERLEEVPLGVQLYADELASEAARLLGVPRKSCEAAAVGVLLRTREAITLECIADFCRELDQAQDNRQARAKQLAAKTGCKTAAEMPARPRAPITFTLQTGTAPCISK